MGEVVNLWVRREERKREARDSELVWRCTCGCASFMWSASRGLVCGECDRVQIDYI